MAAERRAHERYHVWFPVQLDAGLLGSAVGIAKDVSVDGLCFDADACINLGTPVRLRFRVASHETVQIFDGTVVRAQPNDSNRSTWPYRLTVQFDAPYPALDARLRDELAQQQSFRLDPSPSAPIDPLPSA